MKSGFAKRIITPSFFTRMAGFDRREGPATGTLDELYVTVLALIPDKGEAFVLCAYDLLGVELGLARRIYAEVGEALHIPSENVWACATHTHSAPSAVFAYSSAYSPEYVEFLCTSTVQAAREAVNAAQETSVRMGSAEVDGIASLRDMPREVSAYNMPLRVITFGGHRLVRFACHPTILNEKNLLYSRDLPGAAGLENAIFVNGACGDLSTRYTRQGSGVPELMRMGALLRNAVEQTEPVNCGDFDRKITATRESFWVPQGLSFDESQRAGLIEILTERMKACTDREAQREYDARLAVLERPKQPQSEYRELEVCCADLGGALLAGLPFEVNCADGAEIEAELSTLTGRPTLLLCYTGGYDGYLPSGRPVDADSSYQDFASKLPPYTRQRAVDALIICANRLRNL